MAGNGYYNWAKAHCLYLFLIVNLRLIISPKGGGDKRGDKASLNNAGKY